MIPKTDVGLLIFCLILMLAGCHNNEVNQQTCYEFNLIEGLHYRPGNIQLAFSVSTCEGKPVVIDQNDVEQFFIQEEGKTVSALESKQTIIQNPSVFDRDTLILLDLSNSILGDEEGFTKLQEAVSRFVDQIGDSQDIAVYTFDGRSEIQQLIDFTPDLSTTQLIRELNGYQEVDPSTNLNGAIVQGLKLLDSLESKAPIRSRTLVVFTDGTDQAGRVSDAEALQAIEQTSFFVMTIGLGAEIDHEYLEIAGKNGSNFAQNSDEVVRAFNIIARRIEDESSKFYVLRYCTPKRAGINTLSLSLQGGSGSLEYTFSAEGFEPGCNPLEDAPLPNPSTQTESMITGMGGTSTGGMTAISGGVMVNTGGTPTGGKTATGGSPSMGGSLPNNCNTNGITFGTTTFGSGCF